MMNIKICFLAAGILIASSSAFAQSAINTRSGVCEDSACGPRVVAIKGASGSSASQNTSTTTVGESAPACKTTYEDKVGKTCKIGTFNGQTVYRRNYSCTGSSSGAWGAWYVQSDTCGEVVTMPGNATLGESKYDVMPKETAPPLD